MDSSEIAKSGPLFISKTKEAFAFLETAWGYHPPVDVSDQHHHCHVVLYRNKNTPQLIDVRNAYHPVDYGFEVNVYHSEKDRENLKADMVYHKLKEDQEPDFQFIEEGATALAAFLNSGKTTG